MAEENLAPKPEILEKFLKAKGGNIIPELKKEEVGLIGAAVVKEFVEDWTSSEYARRRETWRKGQELVKQEAQAKNTPFDNAANIKYPLLTTASVQFASRAYPEIVQGNSVVRPKIYGELNLPKSGEQEQEEAQQSKIDRAENVCNFINWQLFNEIHEWEEDTDRMMGMLPLYGTMFRGVYFSQEKGRIVTELCSPEEFVLPYYTPSLKDTPRSSKRVNLYPKQVIERIRAGRYVEFNAFDDEEQESPEEYIEQHRWMDLDDDGFKEPYIVTVHKETSTCLRISPNYRMEDIIINDSGEVSRIKQVQYYVKYTFIPSTDGSIYDLGFFDLLYPINEVVNSTVNQLLDAGTRQNSGTGFISSALGLKKKGTQKLKMNEFVTVPASGGDIRSQIYQMNWAEPSATLFQLLGFMLDAGRDIANLKEVLEGQQDSQQTATTTMALIEQGLKVFSAIYKRIHRSLSEELQLIRFWNNEIRNPLYGEVMDTRLSQDDFSDDDLDFVPVSDPQVVTDMQKMAKVQFLTQFINSPYLDQMKLHERIFEGAKIDGWGELKAGQDPQVQQLQQQLQQYQQIMQKMQEALEDKSHERKVQLLKDGDTAALNEAKAIEAETRAILNIANAEAAEVGAQLDTYQSEVESIRGQRRVRSVDNPSNNGNSQGSAQGPARGGGRGAEQSRPPAVDLGGVRQALDNAAGA